MAIQRSTTVGSGIEETSKLVSGFKDGFKGVDGFCTGVASGTGLIFFSGAGSRPLLGRGRFPRLSSFPTLFSASRDCRLRNIAVFPPIEPKALIKSLRYCDSCSHLFVKAHIVSLTDRAPLNQYIPYQGHQADFDNFIDTSSLYVGHAGRRCPTPCNKSIRYLHSELWSPFGQNYQTIHNSCQYGTRSNGIAS